MEQTNFGNVDDFQDLFLTRHYVDIIQSTWWYYLTFDKIGLILTHGSQYWAICHYVWQVITYEFSDQKALLLYSEVDYKNWTGLHLHFAQYVPLDV